jgi:hypothetical protein
MYKSKSYYSNKNLITNQRNINQKNTNQDDKQIINSFNRILETIINKDQGNFNKEIMLLNKSHNKNQKFIPILKIFDIIKTNFCDMSIEINTNNNTDLKLEYLQYLILYDINETNGEFLEDKLNLAREILKNNNYKLKY